MSDRGFLEKLLDGASVEWKSLVAISKKISSGGTPKTSVRSYYDGDIPWLRTQEVNFGNIWDTGVKITDEGLRNSSANWIPKNCVIVAMYGATVGKIGINKVPMTTNQACANIQLDPEIADYRYVFHFLRSKYEYIKSLGTGSQTNINAGIVKALEVPIPCPEDPEKSLAIQAEIVRILDNFTELTAELTAELEARKQQYNHYRHQLLSFEDGEVEWKTLGELTKIKTGQSVNKNVIAANPGEYPVINSGREPLGFINDWNTENDPIGITSRGAGVGSVTWREGKYFRGNLNYAVTILGTKDLDVRYLYHLLEHLQPEIKSLCTFDGIPALNAVNLKKLKIPVPQKQVQTHKAAILDKFDTLTTSLSEGLPREIKLRQQQYEYYRDLLLSFPKPEEAA